MKNEMWYHKIAGFLRGLSGWWIIIPILLTIFNVVTMRSYEIVEKQVGGQPMQVIVDSHLDLASWRALGNYILLSIFVGLFVLHRYFKDSAKHSEYKRIRETMDNLCEEIHSFFNLDSTYRVSIFEMKNECLEIIGRFSEYESQPRTQVRFRADVGSVGIAYYTGNMHKLDNLPDFETSPDPYYEMMDRLGNMNKEDVNRLARKHRSYLSVPMKYHQSGRVCAILVMDCSEQEVFTRNQALVEGISNLMSYPFVTYLFPRSLT